MSQVRLSICITTLNRAAFLKQTLESILPQVTDEVELIVLDATSSDNTPEVMKSFVERFPRLRYVRREKEIPGDQKYPLLVEMSHGEYCWLFADDDLIRPGGVAAVLEATRKKYSLIIVNAEVRGADLADPVQACRVKVEADRVYTPSAPDRDRLLADAGVYLSFLGALVMRRDVWDQRDRNKYQGTNFVHTAMIFQSPLPGDTLLIAHPWITIRYGNGLWIARSFEIWMFNWPKVIWSFSGVSDWAKEKVVPREPWRDWKRLLLDRAMGRYWLRDYDSLLAPHLKSPLRKVLSRAIAAAPIPPLNLLARFFVRFVLRKSPSIALYDLRTWRRQTAGCG